MHEFPYLLGEYLTLIEAVDAGLASYDVLDFYYLARATMVKDERNLDKFDRVFGEVFKGIETDNHVCGNSGGMATAAH